MNYGNNAGCAPSMGSDIQRAAAGYSATPDSASCCNTGPVPVPPIAPENSPPAAPGPQGGSNVPSLPIAPENSPPVYPGPEGGSNVPSLPIAPDNSPPVYPGPGGSNVPSLPIAPDNSPPVDSGCGGCNIPSFPIAPSPGFPVWPGPVIPSNPCRVRFLQAAVGYDRLRITAGGFLMDAGLPYSNMTDYQRINDGFHLVTVSLANNPRRVILRKRIPFRSGDVMTLAVINTSNGLDILQISDLPCMNVPAGTSCLRAANLSFDSPPFDVKLREGGTVFSDIRFKQVTGFKNMQAGLYDLYIVQTGPTPRESGIETVEYSVTPSVEPQPLISVLLDAEPDVSYTLYIIGSMSNSPAVLQAMIVADW